MIVTADAPLSTAGTRLTAKGLATRQRIASAATTLMLERGVARTTIEDIQEAAQVSASQLYHYFADKGSLVTAVIELVADQVLGFQRLGLDRLDSFEALERWRDMIIGHSRKVKYLGGCPLGTLAADLSDTDPVARAQLMASFGEWEKMLRAGLSAMRDRGEIGPEADPDELAMALLASVQGGLLLTQVRRQITPLEVAIDSSIAHIRTFAT